MKSRSNTSNVLVAMGRVAIHQDTALPEGLVVCFLIRRVRGSAVLKQKSLASSSALLSLILALLTLLIPPYQTLMVILIILY